MKLLFKNGRCVKHICVLPTFVIILLLLQNKEHNLTWPKALDSSKNNVKSFTDIDDQYSTVSWILWKLINFLCVMAKTDN